MDAAFEYEYRSAEYEYEGIQAGMAALIDEWPELERFAKLRFAHSAHAINVDRRSTGASLWSSHCRWRLWIKLIVWFGLGRSRRLRLG